MLVLLGTLVSVALHFHQQSIEAEARRVEQEEAARARRVEQEEAARARRAQEERAARARDENASAKENAKRRLVAISMELADKDAWARGLREGISLQRSQIAEQERLISKQEAALARGEGTASERIEAERAIQSAYSANREARDAIEVTQKTITVWEVRRAALVAERDAILAGQW